MQTRLLRFSHLHHHHRSKIKSNQFLFPTTLSSSTTIVTSNNNNCHFLKNYSTTTTTRTHQQQQQQQVVEVVEQQQQEQVNLLQRTISYPIYSSLKFNDKTHLVYQKEFILPSSSSSSESSSESSPLNEFNLEINTRNMNVEICYFNDEQQHDQGFSSTTNTTNNTNTTTNTANKVKIEVYTHNCNPNAWYDLNQTPQGFFSSYKIESLYRELTNTLRINVHQAPIPSLFYRHKLFHRSIDNVFLPNSISKLLESKSKFTTMKVYLPSSSTSNIRNNTINSTGNIRNSVNSFELNSIKIETDIGNIIFRNLHHVNHCAVKSSFGSCYIDGDGGGGGGGVGEGLHHVKQFNLEMMYGCCFIKKISNCDLVKINHLFAIVDHFGYGSGILKSNSITLDCIDENSVVKIHTVDPIDLFLNQLSLTRNNSVSIVCRTKDNSLMTYTSNGIQVFISDEEESVSSSSSSVDVVDGGNNKNKLSIFSDSNPITCYFDKNSVVNYPIQALSQRSDISIDYNNILFDGSDGVNSVNGTIVSRRDSKRLHQLVNDDELSNNDSNITNDKVDDHAALESTSPTVMMGGNISMTCRHHQIHVKQYEYLLPDDNNSPSDGMGSGSGSGSGSGDHLANQRLLYQQIRTDEFYIQLLDYRIAKRDAFVYVSMAVLLIIYVSIIKFYSIPAFDRQSLLKNSGMASMTNTPTNVSAMRPSKE